MVKWKQAVLGCGNVLGVKSEQQLPAGCNYEQSREPHTHTPARKKCREEEKKKEVRRKKRNESMRRGRKRAAKKEVMKN